MLTVPPAQGVGALEHGGHAAGAVVPRYAAGDRIAVIAYPRQEIDAEVVVSAVPGALSAAAIDVVADRGSTVNLSIVVEDENVYRNSISGVFRTTVILLVSVPSGKITAYCWEV